MRSPLNPGDSWCVELPPGKNPATTSRNPGGRKAYEGAIAPNDDVKLAALMSRAKGKLGPPEDAPVFSCYEAGRDGFWPHRFLEEHRSKGDSDCSVVRSPTLHHPPHPSV
jgi:hypothetical protein